jgi:hypothetical protein
VPVRSPWKSFKPLAGEHLGDGELRFSCIYPMSEKVAQGVTPLVRRVLQAL